MGPAGRVSESAVHASSEILRRMLRVTSTTIKTASAVHASSEILRRLKCWRGYARFAASAVHASSEILRRTRSAMQRAANNERSPREFRNLEADYRRGDGGRCKHERSPREFRNLEAGSRSWCVELLRRSAVHASSEILRRGISSAAYR